MTTNPPTARDRIAEALYAHNHPGWATRYTDLDRDERDTYLARASAVLAALPTADRGAILREAADAVNATPYPSGFTAGFDKGARWATTLLRRMADEAQQQPDTETRDAIARVRALHVPSSYPNPDGPGEITYCLGCEHATGGHPCNTLAALDEQPASGPGRVADEEHPETRCTCADAGGCFAPSGHYADCPQADAPAVVSQPGKET